MTGGTVTGGTAAPPDVLELLWPGGGRAWSRRPGSSAGQLLVLPSRQRPRLLVPTGVPGAQDMVLRHSTGSRQRLLQRSLLLAQRSGVLPWLPVWRLTRPAGAGAGINDYVLSSLPGAAAIGVLLGPPRANAKPVLRVFDGSGATIAFGKVGHTDLSRALVRREREVLEQLSRRPIPGLETPRLLHHGQWRGLEVLLMSALTTSTSRRPDWRLPIAAMQQVAGRDASGPVPPEGSGYVERLRARLALLDTGRSELGRLLDRALKTYGGTPLRFGWWHGDWAPWNMSASEGAVRVWDWERADADVPYGFDMIHFLVQRQLGSGEGSLDADQLLAEARPGFQEAAVGDEPRRATVLLYLVEILSRYRADAGTGPTPALQRRIAHLEGLFDAVHDDHIREPHVDA